MTVSSGIAMEIHYCMGEKAGVDFYKNSEDKCSRCGMKNKVNNGCCSDDHKFFKIEDSHQKAVADYNFSIGDIAIVNCLPLFNWKLPPSMATNQVFNNSPPQFSKPPARILHGVFRL